MTAARDQLSGEAVSILIHALGGSHRESPLGWRNYYCAGKDTPDLEALVASGHMVRGHVDHQSAYYHCTELGKGIAMANDPRRHLKAYAVTWSGLPDNPATIHAMSAGKAKYEAFLSVRDSWPDAKIQEFSARRIPRA